jgi:hypothetical protein
MTVFDRIELHIGSEATTARPYDFVFDKHRNPIEAIMYETTCPDCGQCMQFNKNEIKTDDGRAFVICGGCQKPPKFRPIVQIQIKDDGQHIENEHKRNLAEKMREEVTPWIDPIAAGIFHPNQVEYIV